MCRGHILLVTLMEKKLLERFTKKNYKKQIKESLELKKQSREKDNKLYVKWKEYNNLFNSWIDKREIVWMGEYFPKPKSLGANVKIKLDLSNYATKPNLKNATGIDTLSFTK